MKRRLLRAGVAYAFVFAVILALPAYGGTVQLYSIHGFVDMLVARGIIPTQMSDKAHELATFIHAAEPVLKPQVPYASDIEVTTSQLIQYSFRRYEQGNSIRGILLLAQNTSNTDVYPSAVRGCQIIYSIYKDETLLYDSSTKKACIDNELVSYQLGPQQTRMFEVKHATTDYPLDKGLYTMRVEYPGYGDGSVSFEIY